MRIDLIYPELPPAINGIGDHTKMLAITLAGAGHQVRILARGSNLLTDTDLRDARVAVVNAWPSRRLWDIRALLSTVRSGRADIVLLQFEQFSYGRWGLNPVLPLLFPIMRLTAGASTRVLYAHENYTSGRTAKRRVMQAYQHAQFRVLTRHADSVLVTTEAWLTDETRTRKRVAVVPVFSNVPPPTEARLATRKRLEIEAGTVIAIWFGNIDDSRTAYFRESAKSISRYNNAAMLYVGPDAARAHDLAWPILGARLLNLDGPPISEIPDLFASADIGLAPYANGVSTRRGAFLACLQQGVPTLTTLGPETDPLLRRASERGVAFQAAEEATPTAFAALLDDALRLQVLGSVPLVGGRDGRSFYESNFSPARTAAEIVGALRPGVPLQAQ